jgi:hypothetical protein
MYLNITIIKLMSLIKDIKIFNKRLIKFDIIRGICENNTFNLLNIKEKINIELFYNLPHDLRYDNYAAWSIHMMKENRNIPYHMRSNHKFPKIYNLEYTNENIKINKKKYIIENMKNGNILFKKN